MGLFYIVEKFKKKKNLNKTISENRFFGSLRILYITVKQLMFNAI